MHFLLSVHLTDQDYLDYNTFWMLRSPYGKKQVVSLRIFIALFFSAVALLFLLSESFSAIGWCMAAVYLILLALFELLLNTFLAFTLKQHLKSLKKKGKMGYSPVAEVTFFEDRISETTSEGKSEQVYSSIERISVIEGKTVYLHVNNVMAYILPRTAFASEEEYAEFLAFIKTKCANIDIYRA